MNAPRFVVVMTGSKDASARWLRLQRLRLLDAETHLEAPSRQQQCSSAAF